MIIRKASNHFLFLILFSLLVLSTNNSNGQESVSKTIDFINMADGEEKLNEYIKVIEAINSNYPDSALGLIPEALRLAKLEKDRLKEAEILFFKSFSLSIKGRTSEAIETARLAIDIFDQIDNQPFKARAISFLGTVYGDIGNYSEAALLFDQALKISEQQNDTLGIINGFLRLGVIQSFQNQNIASIEYYDQALELARAANRENSIKTLLNNLGIAYAKQGLFEQALVYFHEAENLERVSEFNISYFTQLISNIGQAYYHIKNYSKSLEYLKEVEDLILNNDARINPTVKINNNINFGKLYIALNQYSQAEIYINNALKIAIEIGSLSSMQNSYEQLTEFYKTTKQFEKALESSRLANDLRDSIFNTEKFEIIESLKTQYEVDKKNAELTLLADLNQSRTYERNLLALLILVILILLVYISYNYANKIRVNKQLLDKQYELEEINRMKNKLFSIIGHDLRGPFQGILGGLFLIKDNAFEEKEMKEFIQKLIESGKATHEVLESLLVWGKAQSFESNIESLNVKKLIYDSIKPYKEAARQKNIQINNNVIEDIYVLADYKEIEFVLRNLINNAIKYTHPNGLVSLITHKDGNKLKIDIIDNGIGIPSYRIPFIFDIDQIRSTTGTKNEAGSGLGLVVCNDLIIKNKGQIKVESELGHGSKFTIILPLA